MPHLEYCGRIWRVATDTMSCFSSSLLIFRVVWVVFLTVILISFGLHPSATCRDDYTLFIYLAVSLLTHTASIICQLLIIYTSLLGSMAQTELRRNINSYLSAHIVFTCLQCASSIYGWVNRVVNNNHYCLKQLFLFFCLLFSLIVLNTHNFLCSNTFQENDTLRGLLYFVALCQLIEVGTSMCCCKLFKSRK